MNYAADVLGRLSPSEKVRLAMEMSEAAVRICAAGIRAENPGISDEELMERLRERLEWVKSRRRPGVKFGELP